MKRQRILYFLPFLAALILFSSCSEYQNVRWVQGEKGEKGEKGDSYILTYEDKQEIISSIVAQNSEIPDYWISELEEGTKAINQALCTAGANKSAFLFYTDSHWNYGSQMSPLLLKYLYEHTGINKTIFGGDIVNDESSEYETMEYLWQWRSMLKDLPNHHSVVGNHDDGNTTNNLFSEEYVYGYLLAPEETPDIVRENNGLYYYIDNPSEKTRYLYLDTAYIGFNSSQKEFVRQALLSTPDKWHIIAIAHCWYDVNYDSTPPTVSELSRDASILVSMFDNYNLRVGEYAECRGYVEFCIGGHAHVDYDGYSATGIPIILMETDSKQIRNGKDDSEYKYVDGTPTEASVNGIIADYDNHKIYVVRVGRGTSREVELVKHPLDYTNVLPKALDVDEESVYNDKGYKENTRWSTSQQLELEQSGTFISGWIAVSNGDVIRIKNADISKDSSMTVVFFSQEIGNTSGSINAEMIDKYNRAVWDENGNLKEFTVIGNYNYIRIQCSGFTSESVITINEALE